MRGSAALAGTLSTYLPGPNLMRVNDVVAGIVLIAISVFMFALTLSFPPFPGQKYGPSLFPRILAVAIIFCGVLLIIRGLKSRRAGEPWASVVPWMRQGPSVLSFLAIPLAILAYILLSEPIGFAPVAFAILGLLFAWFGVKPLNAVIIAAVSTWTIHFFFANLMRVPLPRGLLNYIL